MQLGEGTQAITTPRLGVRRWVTSHHHHHARRSRFSGWHLDMQTVGSRFGLCCARRSVVNRVSSGFGTWDVAIPSPGCPLQEVWLSPIAIRIPETRRARLSGLRSLFVQNVHIKI